MILRFLRWFSEFRALEGSYRLALADVTELRASLDALSTDKLMLQDRLEAALNDKTQLWTAMQEALNNERSALRMQVNHAVQRAGGGIPYPEEHSLPPTAARSVQEPGPVGRRGRQLPSEMVHEQTQRFLKDFVAGVKRG